jgi:hypothetical protein
MNIIYWVYTRVFWCLRRFHTIFSQDFSKPIQLRDSKWLYVDATFHDGTTLDVTEILRDTARHDMMFTPAKLSEMTNLTDVKNWGYLTTTLDYNKITTEGVVNGL